MKNITILIIAVLISTVSFSQKNLKNTFTSHENLFEVSNGVYKYYSVDERKSAVSIYNLDNSIFKTIKLDIPADAWLDEILLISADKINKDSNIEVAYTIFYETSEDEFDNEENTYIDNYDLIVINEKGEQIFNVKDGRNISIVKNKSADFIVIETYRDENYVSSFKSFVYSSESKKSDCGLCIK